MQPFVITIEHGAPAVRTIFFRWEDGSSRPVSGNGARLTAYSGRGDLTAALFTIGGGQGETDDSKTFAFTATQATPPGSAYYCTIDLLDDQGAIVPDGRWHGTLAISGRG